MKNLKTHIVIIVLFTILLPLHSCKKVDESLKSKNKIEDIATNKSNQRLGNNIDSSEYYIYLDCPTRDAINYIKSGGTLPPTSALKIGENPKPILPQTSTTAIAPTYPNYHCCNGICLTIPEDPYSYYAPFRDIWVIIYNS